MTPTVPVNASTQLPDMSQLSVKEPSVTFGMMKFNISDPQFKNPHQPFLVIFNAFVRPRQVDGKFRLDQKNTSATTSRRSFAACYDRSINRLAEQ